MNQRAFFLLLFLVASAAGSQAAGYRLQATGRDTAVSSHITAGKYCLFLNAVATADLSNLYEPSSQQIVHLGTPGRYHYEVMEGKEQLPMAFMSGSDAARYLQWKEYGDDSCEVAEGSFADFDPCLKSNRLFYNLSMPSAAGEDFKNSSAETGDESWKDIGRIIFGGGSTIATLFSEGHFSLEAARRIEAEQRRAASLPEVGLVTTCSTSKAVLESLKPHDAITRLRSERDDLLKEGAELHDKRASSSPLQTTVLSEGALYEEAAQLEERVHELEQRTVFGQLGQAVDDLALGFGRLSALGFHISSPVLDNSRRTMGAGVIGYGVGALVAYLRDSNFSTVMSNGSLGALAGAVPVLLYNLYDTYQHLGAYREALQTRYAEMKNAFAQAKGSYRNAWTISQELSEARVQRTTFYQGLLGEYEELKNTSEEVPSALAALLLQAQAHQIEAVSESHSIALEQWIEMGNKFYGEEIMKHVIPQESRALFFTDKKQFIAAKDQMLAALRCNHVAFTEHLRKHANELVDGVPSSVDRLKSLKIFADDLKGIANNDVLKLQNGHGFLRGMIGASGAFLYETVFLGGKVAMMSVIGFLTGSFIGAVIPLSYSAHDFSAHWPEINTTAVAYSFYFLCVDLSNSNNMIRQSAHRTAAAWLHVTEVWNKARELRAAQGKLAEAQQKHAAADERYRQAKENASTEESTQETSAPTDDNEIILHVFDDDQDSGGTSNTPIRTPLRNSWMRGRVRNSVMPGTNYQRFLRESVERLSLDRDAIKKLLQDMKEIEDE